MIIQINLPTLAETGSALAWIAFWLVLVIVVVVARASMRGSEDSQAEERSAWYRRMNGFVEGPMQ